MRSSTSEKLVIELVENLRQTRSFSHPPLAPHNPSAMPIYPLGNMHEGKSGIEHLKFYYIDRSVLIQILFPLEYPLRDDPHGASSNARKLLESLIGILCRFFGFFARERSLDKFCVNGRLH